MGVVDKILEFNRGREPERLSMKYQRMSISPFVFYPRHLPLVLRRSSEARRFQQSTGRLDLWRHAY